MTSTSGLDEHERPVGEVPALPGGFHRPTTRAPTSAARTLRYELIAA